MLNIEWNGDPFCTTNAIGICFWNGKTFKSHNSSALNTLKITGYAVNDSQWNAKCSCLTDLKPSSGDRNDQPFSFRSIRYRCSGDSVDFSIRLNRFFCKLAVIGLPANYSHLKKIWSKCRRRSQHENHYQLSSVVFWFYFWTFPGLTLTRALMYKNWISISS